MTTKHPQPETRIGLAAVAEATDSVIDTDPCATDRFAGGDITDTNWFAYCDLRRILRHLPYSPVDAAGAAGREKNSSPVSMSLSRDA